MSAFMASVIAGSCFVLVLIAGAIEGHLRRIADAHQPQPCVAVRK